MRRKRKRRRRLQREEGRGCRCSLFQERWRNLMEAWRETDTKIRELNKDETKKIKQKIKVFATQQQ